MVQVSLVLHGIGASLFADHCHTHWLEWWVTADGNFSPK